MIAPFRLIVDDAGAPTAREIDGVLMEKVDPVRRATST
jgi:hypothetical protein